MERVGRSRRSQAALRRHPGPPEAGCGPRGFRRSRTRCRPGQAAPVRVVAKRSGCAGQDCRARIHAHRRPRPAAARWRQVHPRHAATEGHRHPGCARRGPAARRRPGRCRDPAVLLGSGHRDHPVWGRHQRDRWTGPQPRPVQRRDLAGPTPVQRTALPRRSLGHRRAGRRRHRPGRRTAARRARLLSRALPAELRIRNHRRLRGDPVLRPGFGRVRPLQRHDHRLAHGHSGRRAGSWSGGRLRRRSGPASAGDRLGRCFRCHHQGAAAGAPGARNHPI